jgi:sporulation protein YlmC with PRC-barrel domain
MLKTFMISAAVSALMVSGALAQADKPADNAKFITSQSQDQWVFSKFKGTDVLGPDNAHIGNVNDVLFDKQGKIFGLIVGVGGFLGIGEKNVAIDMSAFQPVPYDTGSSTSGASTATRNDAHHGQAQSELDERSAQGSAGLPVLQAAVTHEQRSRWHADHRDGASSNGAYRAAGRPLSRQMFRVA